MKKYSRIIALLLSVVLILPGAGLVTKAEETTNVVRLAGKGRIETAVEVSKEAYKTGADAVVLAGHVAEADSLTGTLLAGVKNAPLLLTRKGELTTETAAEIARLKAKTVYILGGEAAVSANVEEALEALELKVVRVEGLNRYLTAAAVAEEVQKTEEFTHAFVVRGLDTREGASLADALAVGPVSATKKDPVLLVNQNELRAETKQAITDLGVTHVTIVGGTSAVSADVEAELEAMTGVTVKARVFGDGRDETALEIAKEYFPTATTAVIANRVISADALVGGYFAAMHKAPILLTAATTPSADTLAFLEANTEEAYVLGGETVVTAAAFTKITDAVDFTEDLKVVSVSAIGAKKLEVKFNKAIDTSKAAFAVKKGTIAVNADKIEFAEDKMSATITTTTNLTKGDYTVTVTGLTEEALTATVAIENEKVSKINIGPKAPRLAGDKTAKVSYEVLNQYGEKMVGQTISWNISTGVAATSEVNGESFVITAAGGADFVPGAKVYITGVHAASGTVVNTEVEVVLAAKANTVQFKGVYDTNKGELTNLPAGFASGRYVLLLEVNDQYGNKLSSPTMSDLVFTSNNPAFVSSTLNVASPATETINNVTYQAIQLVPGSMVSKGGEVTIQAISKVTGATSSFAINADALSAVKTLAMSAPAKMVAEKETVEIPFTAVDQFGNAVTKFETLNSQVTLTPAFAAGTGLKFVKQNDGSAKLEYTAPASGATATTDLPVYLTSLVTQGGDFSSLMLSVKEEAVPTTISGLNSKISQSIAKGNNVEILGSDLVILDQYGREMTKAAKEAWLGASTNANRIVVTSEKPATDKSPFTVVSTHAGEGSDGITRQIDTNTEKITIAAKTATGLNKTEKLIFVLSTDSASTTIASSAKSLTFTSVEQSLYSSYEVEDLGTMYNDGHITNRVTTHDKTLKVYGVLANGTKVLLPASDYSVSTDGKLDTTTTNGVIADLTSAGYDNTATPNPFKDANGNDKDIKVNVLVTVNDANGAAAAILEKELLVSNVAPEVTTVGFDSDIVTDGKATLKGDAVTNAKLNSVIDLTEVKDQYGVVKTETPNITITNLTKVDGSALTVSGNGSTSTAITGAKMGDKFTATYKYVGGKTVSVDITVGLDDTAPLVTSSLAGTGSGLTIAADGSENLTFSEELNSTSKAAVESALTAGKTGTGTMTLSWANDKTLVISEIGSSNNIILGASANITANITDLSGNTTTGAILVTQ